jgi:hypothetical protein
MVCNRISGLAGNHTGLRNWFPRIAGDGCNFRFAGSMPQICLKACASGADLDENGMHSSALHYAQLEPAAWAHERFCNSCRSSCANLRLFASVTNRPT